MSGNPPRLPARLLGLLVPPGAREFLLGDLHERYGDVRAAKGRALASAWYWMQALRACVSLPALWRASGPLALAEPRLGVSARRSRWASFTETLVRDARHAGRTLRRDASATTFAVVIAGLGIAACATVFSLCQALLLRPLPFREPGRLVWIANGTSENLSGQTVQVSNLLQLRSENRSFSDVAAFSPFYQPEGTRLTGEGTPERVTGVPVVQNFFPLLGVRPLLGRFFDDEESRSRTPVAAVLDFRFWRRRFGADPGVIGRTMVLDGTSVPIVGVLPAAFDFEATFTPGRRADYFVPFPLSDATDRQGNTLALVGRLREGVSLEAAQVEASAIGARIVSGRVGDRRRNGFAPLLSTLRHRVSGQYTPALLVLVAAVGFLLLLVCANLSNLLLVRGAGRRREMAVRAALGASRRHLVRQLLLESLLLGGSGAAVGLLLAAGGTLLISRIEGTTIPLLRDVRVDGVVLAFTALVAVLVSVGVGILPALQATAAAIPTALAEGVRGSTGGRAGWFRRVTVVAEIALGCVLVTGAGLLARSLLRVLAVRPGFATTNVLAVRVDPVRNERSDEARSAYLHALVSEVASVPGVDALGLTDALPLGDNFGWRRWGVTAPGSAFDGDHRISPLIRAIDPGYLATMEIPLAAGRPFTAADDAAGAPVVIVNDLLASRLFPGQDPVGRTIRTGSTERRIVGVVGAARYFSLDRGADPELYLPVDQIGSNSIDLVVRGRTPPGQLVAGVRAALQRVDPTLPVTTFRTMKELIDRSLFPRRVVVLLVAGFAAFGLVLFSLGLYAVIAYGVSQRTLEIGIRMALGATPARVRAEVLRDTGTLVAAGLGIGLPLSWLATRAIRGLLYGVGPSDPVTYAAVLVTIAAAAAFAGFVPARRATRIDPATALRAD